MRLVRSEHEPWRQAARPNPRPRIVETLRGLRLMGKVRASAWRLYGHRRVVAQGRTSLRCIRARRSTLVVEGCAPCRTRSCCS